MRSWQVTRAGEPSEVLELGERSDSPRVDPGFVRIRVAAVGIVTAVAPGTRCRVGDRIMGVTAFFVGHGAFAEECLLLEDFALPVPEGMDDVEAAAFTIPFHTAYVGLVQRARLARGESLLVLGAAGGTGQAAVQLGKALGARVIAVAGGEEKCRYCRGLGADEVIDYRSEDIAASARRLTNAKGADVIWDSVGGDAFEAATGCIASEGRLLLIGSASGRWGVPSAQHITTHNYSVLGVIPTKYDHEFRLAAHARLAALRAAGKIHSGVQRTFEFEELASALTLLASGRSMGKLVSVIARERPPRSRAALPRMKSDRARGER